MANKKWYRLDNVGHFYSSLKNAKIPQVFRYSAVLEEDIDKDILQSALNKTIEIFPNFNVNLRKGFFWYYLDETSKIYQVTEENLPICFKLYKSSDDFLYRVSYYKKKINFETSHILSDGRGSIEFFKLLITNYINEKYDLKIDTTKNNKSTLEKTEDSFDKYYQKLKSNKDEKPVKKQKPYLFKGKKFNDQTLFMECHMSAKKIKDLALKYDTTLTALLTAILIYSFKDEMKLSDMDKYVKIDIPVDLRGYFKSSSSMNFFGVTTISYKFNSKEDTIEDIIKEVNEQLKENLKKENLIKRVNMMVSLEKNWFCKVAPFFIKDIVLTIANKIASRLGTTCFSNLGVVKLDKEIEDRVKSISVITSTTGFQFTSCTLKNDLCLGISSRYVHNDVIMNFCRFLSSNDIDIKIDVSEVE